MGHKIAIRVKPLKQWSDVSNATRHGKREDPAKHVDRVRTHLNQHWPGGPERAYLDILKNFCRTDQAPGALRYMATFSAVNL